MRVQQKEWDALRVLASHLTTAANTGHQQWAVGTGKAAAPQAWYAGGG